MRYLLTLLAKMTFLSIFETKMLNVEFVIIILSNQFCSSYLDIDLI